MTLNKSFGETVSIVTAVAVILAIYIIFAIAGKILAVIFGAILFAGALLVLVVAGMYCLYNIAKYHITKRFRRG